MIIDGHGRTRPPLTVRVWNDDPTGYFYLWAANSVDTFYSAETYSFADNDTLRIIALMMPAPEAPVELSANRQLFLDELLKANGYIYPNYGP